MRVYVVIVTYNASRWLFTCLNSLRASAQPVSVVVIDNNSSDDTTSIIKTHFSEVILIQSADNVGFGKANNAGIKYALTKKADYIFLLNQDAWVKPDTIKQLIQIQTKHPDYFILSPLHLEGSEKQLDYNFSKYASPDSCNQLFSDFVLNRDNLKDVYPTRFVNAALWLLPKKCLTTIGGFDPVFPHYGEDDDFINRVHFHGYKAGICPSAIGVHDRSQEPFDINKLEKKKRYNRMKVDILILLKNINHRFSLALARAYAIIIKGLLVNILQLKFSIFFSYVKLFFYTTSNIYTIKSNREISKDIRASDVWINRDIKVK